MTKKNNSIDDLLASIIKGIEDVKGLDIDILDLRGIDNRVCDYFVICNGTSNTQVNAIVNSVQKGVSKELKDKPWHVEGTDNGEWVLMDYVSIVVHVFQKHIREYYNIESLWGDAKITSLENKF
ncbi:ribosome silencing factor [Flavobacterium sp. 20NA77.7]|jgi:ribosome-associated protein|uniref:Ribosomal silencing factor RsfS n=1 Tax=Flavobacterium nakdongensis TaxID=3073563 RepID=A0ABY9RBW3_9FLAO|nr:ribosome silencing factor [Flavobacterium sp. 20NA77.7]WMW78451.1 ribosome silencing factor [Flavobacterium sp. 20NA77.7]